MQENTTRIVITDTTWSVTAEDSSGNQTTIGDS